MSRFNKLLLKFDRVRKNLERSAYLSKLPALPFVVKQRVEPGDLAEQGVDAEGIEWINFLRGEASVRDMPGYSEHNRLHEEAARERKIQAKEYLFDPAEEGQDVEFTEFEEGWPPPINTD